MQISNTLADLGGKPVCTLLHTWSDIQGCHAHLKQRIKDVNRSVRI